MRARPASTLAACLIASSFMLASLGVAAGGLPHVAIATPLLATSSALTSLLSSAGYATAASSNITQVPVDSTSLVLPAARAASAAASSGSRAFVASGGLLVLIGEPTQDLPAAIGDLLELEGELPWPFLPARARCGSQLRSGSRAGAGQFPSSRHALRAANIPQPHNPHPN
jgi:hypothetical protein